MVHPAARNLLVAFFFAFALLVWVGVHQARLLGEDPAVFYLGMDLDVSLRVSIIRDLLQGQPWQDHLVHRLGAAPGIETPWTRVVDMLVIALAAPFLPFQPLDGALLSAALIYGPIMALISLYYLLRLADDDHPGGVSLHAALFVVIAFVTYPATISYFRPGNVDHHSLLATLTVALVYYSQRNAIVSGLIIGLGIWVSIEFQIPAALYFAWLGALWCYSGEKYRALQIVQSSLSAVFILLLALVTEHPTSRFFEVRYDTVSIVSLSLVVATAFIGFVVYKLSKSLKNPVLTVQNAVNKSAARRLSRFFAGLIIALSTLILLLHFFPLLAQGPMASVDPRMKKEFLPLISEMQPLYKQGLGFCYTIFSIIGFICLRIVRKDVVYTPYVWLLIGGTCVFFALSMSASRMTYYLFPFSILFLLHVLHILFKFKDEYRQRRQGLGFILAALFPIYLADFSATLGYDPEALLGNAQHEQKTNNLPICKEDFYRLLETGKLHNPLDGNPATIVTAPEWATHILWKTNDKVMASFYHRDHVGYFNLQSILQWSDAEKAKEVIKQQQVDIIAVCQTERWEMPVVDVLSHSTFASPIADVAPHSPLRIYRINRNLL